MRLVCPNCAAQYEVDDNAIPENGRDVQCAECGQTWFQDAESAGSVHSHRHEHNADDIGHVQDDGSRSAPDPATEAEDADGDADLPEQDRDDAPTPRPKPAAHSPSVLEILRREAEREANARDAEGRADQPDETVDNDPIEPPAEPDAVPDADELAAIDDNDASDDNDAIDEAPETNDLAMRARIARSQLAAGASGSRRAERLHDEAAADTPDDLSAAPKRGDNAHATTPNPLDKDELNATLRPSDDKTRQRRQGGRRGRISNRLGSYLAVLIVLILLAVYMLTDQIGTAFPALKPTLAIYVSVADAARRALADGASVVVDATRSLLARIL